MMQIIYRQLKRFDLLQKEAISIRNDLFSAMGSAVFDQIFVELSEMS